MNCCTESWEPSGAAIAAVITRPGFGARNDGSRVTRRQRESWRNWPADEVGAKQCFAPTPALRFSRQVRPSGSGLNRRRLPSVSALRRTLAAELAHVEVVVRPAPGHQCFMRAALDDLAGLEDQD